MLNGTVAPFIFPQVARSHGVISLTFSEPKPKSSHTSRVRANGESSNPPPYVGVFSDRPTERSETLFESPPSERRSPRSSQAPPGGHSSKLSFAQRRSDRNALRASSLLLGGEPSMTWTGNPTSARRERLPDDWEVNYRRPVLKRDRGVCQIRGPHCLVRATHVDHIHRGDDHSLGNLQSACKRCHAPKSSAEGVQERAKRRAQGRRPLEKQPWAVRKG